MTMVLRFCMVGVVESASRGCGAVPLMSGKKGRYARFALSWVSINVALCGVMM